MKKGVVIPFLPYLWVKLKLLMESKSVLEAESGLYYATWDQWKEVSKLMNSKEKALAEKILDRRRRERKGRQYKSRGHKQ